MKSRRCIDVFFRYIYITNGTNCTSSALRLLIPEWKPVSNSGNVKKLALPVVFSWFNIDGFDVDISTFVFFFPCGFQKPEK